MTASPFERANPEVKSVSIKKLFGNLTAVISCLTLVSVIAGGLLGYYHIHRFYVRESKSSKKLLDIERKLGEMDLRVKGVRDALDIASKKVQVSIDIAQVITDLRPKLNIEFDPNVFYSDGRIRSTFHITNLGKYEASVRG